MNKIKIVEIFKTSIWIESDIFGSRFVVIQHATLDPFDYCKFNYNYGYTDNASTLNAATKMALSLGATEPVEHRSRRMESPTRNEIQEQINALRDLLKDCKKDDVMIDAGIEC